MPREDLSRCRVGRNTGSGITLILSHACGRVGVLCLSFLSRRMGPITFTLSKPCSETLVLSVCKVCSTPSSRLQGLAYVNACLFPLEFSCLFLQEFWPCFPLSGLNLHRVPSLARPGWGSCCVPAVMLGPGTQQHTRPSGPPVSRRMRSGWRKTGGAKQREETIPGSKRMQRGSRASAGERAAAPDRPRCGWNPEP